LKSNVKKIVGDGSFILIGDLLVKLKGLLFLPVVLGAIGLESYGILVQSLLIPGVISGICSLSLGASLLRFSSKLDDEKDKKIISEDFFTGLIASVTLAVVGCIGIYLLSGAISENLLGGTPKRIIQLASIMVVNEVIWRFLGFYLKSRKLFKPFSLFNIIYQFTPYFGLVGGIFYTKEIFIGLACMIVTQSFIILILYVLYFQKIEYVVPSWIKFKKFIKFSWPLSLSNISGGLLSKSDRFLISYFLGPESVGIYSILYMVLSFVDQLTTPLRTYYGSYLPKIWDNGKTIEAHKQLQSGVFIFLLIAGLLLSLAYSHLYDFMSLFLKIEINNILFNWSSTIVSIGLGILFLGLSRFQFQLIRLAQKNRWELYIQVLGLCVNVLLNIILLPVVGLLGAGLATLAGYSISYLYGLFRLRPIGYRARWIYMLPSLLGFSLSIRFNFGDSSDIIGLLLGMGITAVIYSTCAVGLAILLNRKTQIIDQSLFLSSFKRGM
jgi:O-antigen/teichoic acid export membrane protein